MLSNSVCTVAVHFAPPSSVPHAAVGYSLLASSPWAPFWLTGLGIKPCIHYSACRYLEWTQPLFTVFMEAAEDHSNDDGISRHRHIGFRFRCSRNILFKSITVLQFTHRLGREYQELITLLLKTNFLTSSLNLLLNSLLSCSLKPISYRRYQNTTLCWYCNFRYHTAGV